MPEKLGWLCSGLIKRPAVQWIIARGGAECVAGGDGQLSNITTRQAVEDWLSWSDVWMTASFSKHWQLETGVQCVLSQRDVADLPVLPSSKFTLADVPACLQFVSLWNSLLPVCAQSRWFYSGQQWRRQEGASSTHFRPGLYFWPCLNSTDWKGRKTVCPSAGLYLLAGSLKSAVRLSTVTRRAFSVAVWCMHMERFTFWRYLLTVSDHCNLHTIREMAAEYYDEVQKTVQLNGVDCVWWMLTTMSYDCNSLLFHPWAEMPRCPRPLIPDRNMILSS